MDRRDGSNHSKHKKQKLFGSSSKTPRKRSREHKPFAYSPNAQAIAFHCENPSSWLVVMRSSYVNSHVAFLWLSSKFAELVRPFTFDKGEVTLRVSSDGRVRTWQVKTNYMKASDRYISDIRIRLGRGWCKFLKENNLKQGDWCVFKLTEEDNGAVVDVFIFRDNNAEDCRSSPGVEDGTAFYDTSGFGQAETDSDSSFDPSLFHVDESDDEDVQSVSSTSSDHAVGSQPVPHVELSDIDERFVPLLEEVCLRHHSLIESKKKNTPLYTKWAFTFLGEVLYFLKTKRIKDMTDDVCADLELSWKELQAFKFDLSWLETHVQRDLNMNQVVKRAEKVKSLRANLEKARRDLEESENCMDGINVENELGYEV